LPAPELAVEVIATLQAKIALFQFKILRLIGPVENSQHVPCARFGHRIKA